jgi:hypothetical protein
MEHRAISRPTKDPGLRCPDWLTADGDRVRSSRAFGQRSSAQSKDKRGPSYRGQFTVGASEVPCQIVWKGA